jgi:DNA-directed RNA polymerase subunit RPC12/RpoP
MKVVACSNCGYLFGQYEDGIDLSEIKEQMRNKYQNCPQCSNQLEFSVIWSSCNAELLKILDAETLKGLLQDKPVADVVIDLNGRNIPDPQQMEQMILGAISSKIKKERKKWWQFWK